MKKNIIFIFSILILNIAFSADLSGIIFSDNKNPNQIKWSDYSKDEKFNIKKLLSYLERSSTGKKLIQDASVKAFELDKELIDIISAGDGSITDTTLIRKFYADEPWKIFYEHQSKIVINKDLNNYDAILDLAHELTHFIYREEFNPYENHMSLEQFITKTIEGRGGEIHAFMMECRVLSEIFPSHISGRYNCMKIYDTKLETLSEHKAKELFYQVGPYFNKFTYFLKSKSIDHKFPLLSDKTPAFFSSAYSLPYPLAAKLEYETVTKKVCENDKNRLSYLTEFEQTQKKSRGIASIQVASSKFNNDANKYTPSQEIKEFKLKYHKRCSH